MRTLSIRIARTLGVCMLGLVSLSLPVQAGEPLSSQKLLAALQQGGYVIYLRHTATDHTQTDQDPLDFTDWTTQRNLSEDGLAQARQIGNALHALGVRVSQVITSPFCRCIETAWHAFGRSDVSHELTFTIGMEEVEVKRRTKALRRMLGTPPPAGTNTVLVSHTANLKEAADVWPKPEGVAMVFKPEENGSFAFLGRIQPGEWAALAAQHGKAQSASSPTPDVNGQVAPKRAMLCGEYTLRPPEVALAE